MNSFPSIDLRDIKGVLIDFDNTLYRYAPCHSAGLLAAYETYSQTKDISYEDFCSLYTEAQKIVKKNTHNQAASHSRFLYFQTMLEQRDGVTNVPATILLEDVYWSAFEKTIDIDKELIIFLEECKKNGLKICLITDLTASVQFRKMMATGVDKLVDFVVTSEESGVEKPHQLIFSLALQKLRLTKDQVVMIGDDIVKDIDGANKIGIKAYPVQP